MTFKPNLSRQARLQAGSRLSLPGQDPLREEEIRIELTEQYQPQGYVERIWIEDIAYRIANIEVIRAQIAACRMRLIETELEDIARRANAAEEMRANYPAAGDDFAVDITAAEREALMTFGRLGLIPMPRSNWLTMPQFAFLLGQLDSKDLHLLRQLQNYEHAEANERSRIINQFERRRRQAVWDAVELVAARRRAGLPAQEDVIALDVRTDLEEIAEPVADAEFALIEDAERDALK